jgi:hypothetical protein
MKLLYPFKILERLFRNLYLLIFLSGFLLASLLYFRMQASYENELFIAIQKNINKKVDLNDTQDSIVVKIMQTCNSLLSNRAPVFTESDDLDGVEVNYLHPASIDLMTARGACGSYSMVLARLLQNYDLPVRIAQMKANGIYGAHNVVEAKIHSGWVVLDPTFDLYFISPENKLASFADVQNNWDFYSKQTPKEYNNAYKYEDARYTNWTKVPMVLPVTKKILDLVIGKEKSNAICMRILFLRIYDVYFYIALVFFILTMILTLRAAIKTKIFPEYNIPFTRTNIVKYFKLYISNRRIGSSVKA